MGLQAHWKITCEHCSREVTRDLDVNQYDPTDENGITTTYLDIWSPGIPHGWIQVHEQVTGSDNQEKTLYRFFHSDECYVSWLRAHDMNNEADEFERGTWIA